MDKFRLAQQIAGQSIGMDKKGQELLVAVHQEKSEVALLKVKLKIAVEALEQMADLENDEPMVVLAQETLVKIKEQ